MLVAELKKEANNWLPAEIRWRSWCRRVMPVESCRAVDVEVLMARER
jgi:hypothetical protein